MQWLNSGNIRCSPVAVADRQEESSSTSSGEVSRTQVEHQETCPICLSSISKEENYTKTMCGHMFCFSCINTSLMSNHTCPMCRTNIEDEPRQKENKKQLNMEDGVNMIAEEIAYFDIKNHVTSAMYEIEHLSMDEKIKKMTRSVKQMTRLYSMKLLQSFIAYEEFDEDEEDDENDEAEDEPYETSDDEDEED